MSDATQIRQAIIEAIPETSNFGKSPDQRLVYVPPGHIKALRLESNVVVGSRGVGKSFWTAALNTPPLRTMLGSSIRELKNTQVRIGFSVKGDIEASPDADVFEDLMAKNFTAYDIWRAVVLRWLADVVGETIPTDSWHATTQWVKANPEPLATLVQKANEAFLSKEQKGLIVFDALDRSSHDWQVMDHIVRDLLRVILWLKSWPRLHAKVFLRDDQFSRTVTDFPDASKLSATKAELTWQPHDLHGLLWQLLCNAPPEHGDILRKLYGSAVGEPPALAQDSWVLSDDVRREGPKQRALFERLAGPWMGKDRRRGVPYIWTVSHLSDGRGRTSPRSFLAAILKAAEDSFEKYPDYTYALHYESIKRGVQKASSIRIDEMAEEYPWVKKLFEPLQRLTVPCEFSVIEARWNQAFPSGIKDVAPDRFPPQHAEHGWPGVREDLERLGFFSKMTDARINMPDLYRVGFGLGRRGGVKPILRQK